MKSSPPKIRFRVRYVALVAACCLITVNPVIAEDDAKAFAFFESKIRPVLVQHCYKCHSSDAKSVKGGLVLDTKAGLLAGGESGAAVIPENTEESLLLNALRYEDYEMPPSGQLSESVISDFEKWIAMGAPDPREDDATIIRREIDLEAGREYWAFQPVANPTPPTTANDDWSTHNADRFIFAKLSERKLQPVADAEPEAWFRRVKFDLLGLPPTPEELKSFASAAEADIATAKEQVVDELLASGHFGERWARHWLDLARYAESTGRTRNYPFPFAWRYRDYVIRSFNEDKPYDQFIVEQIAGDLLSSDDEATRESQLTATGFLAVGSPDLNERNPKIYKMDMVADQIDTVSRSMLGLTVACAQCHDHKFDPIPTEDYYALAGIFQSTDLLNGYASRQGGNNKARGDLLIKLGGSKSQPVDNAVSEVVPKSQRRINAAREAKEQAGKAVARIKRDKSLSRNQRAQQLAAAKRELTKKTRQLNQLRRKLGGKEVKFQGPACQGVRDSKQIANCKIHVRGDVTNLGNEVERGFLQVITGPTNGETATLTIPKDQSGRLQLSHWVASPDNPLTARVLVNRVWRHLFGQGIVRTVDNFGEMGARPTHPELLDHLASQFVANGWSIKQLIRELVLTRTYGLSVEDDAHNAQIDEHNELLWRMNARRLDFEVLRDTLLVVAGKLESSPPSGSSFVQSLRVSEISRQKSMFQFETFRHRSVYLPVLRNLTPEAMSYFDFPDPSETRGARDATNVPTQSLYLLNSPFVIGMARSTAKSLLENDPTGRVGSEAYLRIFGREATDSEAEAVQNYVVDRVSKLEKRNEPKGKGGKERRRLEIAWSEVVHAMFASAEFRYR